METQKQQQKMLKKKIKEKRTQLVGIAKDAHFAETLIDDLLSLKGQLSVEPTELYLPCKNVYEEIKTDTYTIKLMSNGILVAFKSGMTTYIEPYCKALYTEMVELITERKRIMEIAEEERTDEDKDLFEGIDTTFQALMQCFLSPIMGAVSPDILFHVASEQIKAFKKFADETLEKPLNEETTEDHIKNAEARDITETMSNLASQAEE